MHDSKIVIVPDHGGVDSRHWLAHWRSNYPRTMKLAEHDTADLSCLKWLRGIENAVAACGPRTSIVANGLGCLAVAHWARATKRSIDSAMLVGVPDTSSKSFPKAASGFCPVPRSALPFRALVVASEADGDHRHALSRAHDWDASMVVVGRISNETDRKAKQTWDEGLDLLWNLAGFAIAH